MILMINFVKKGTNDKKLNKITVCNEFLVWKIREISYGNISSAKFHAWGKVNTVLVAFESAGVRDKLLQAEDSVAMSTEETSMSTEDTVEEELLLVLVSTVHMVFFSTSSVHVVVVIGVMSTSVKLLHAKDGWEKSVTMCISENAAEEKFLLLHFVFFKINYKLKVIICL